MDRKKKRRFFRLGFVKIVFWSFPDIGNIKQANNTRFTLISNGADGWLDMTP